MCLRLISVTICSPLKLKTPIVCTQEGEKFTFLKIIRSFLYLHKDRMEEKRFYRLEINSHECGVSLTDFQLQTFFHSRGPESTLSTTRPRISSDRRSIRSEDGLN